MPLSALSDFDIAVVAGFEAPSLYGGGGAASAAGDGDVAAGLPLVSAAAGGGGGGSSCDPTLPAGDLSTLNLDPGDPPSPLAVAGSAILFMHP